MSAKNKQVKGEAKQSVKAAEMTLDLKNTHGVRTARQLLGIDVFLLHAFDKLSTAYLTLCIALAQLGKAIVGESVTVFANGVTERVSFDARTGNFSREVGKGQQIFGNLNLLQALYGKDNVFSLSDSEIAARFKSQKEQTTRKLGDGRTITGRVIAQGKKGDMLLDVVAVDLSNGKIALHNLEDKSNAHQRKLNRFSIVQTTDAKKEKAEVKS